MKDIIKIIRYSWSLKRFYIATAIMVVTISLLNQVSPFISKFLVDNIVKRGTGQAVPASKFLILLAALFAIWLIITIITNVQGYVGDLLGAKLNTLLSQRYFDHLLKLPLEFYDNEITGHITARLDRSIATISSLMQAFANNFIGFFLTSFFTLIILAKYSWAIALMLASLFPLYMWLTTLSSRSWQAKQAGINADVDQANGRFIEAISQIRVVKSFAQELTESRFFAGKRRAIEGQTKTQSRQWHKFDVWRRLSLNLVFFGIYSIIIWQAINGHFGPVQQAVGTVVLLLQLTEQAQFPLFASSFIVDNVQKAIAGSKDFFSIMDLEPSIQDDPDAKTLKVDRARVEYNKVDFSYDGGQKVLKDVSFTIEPGTKLALVGESGQGKTTIANLLLRFYLPSKGAITVDGANINGVTQESLRQQVAVVFQEPALFSGSVAENITYGSQKVTEAAMTEAAKAANALDFVNKLPKGFDTEIGERGVKLSGGQKQRIAIARAILKNAPILILDEATSSLDSRAEREVQEALDHLMAERTTMIIAHRLSTIAGVDTIVTLKDGQVDEIGSPEELSKTEGIYAQLLELQAPTKANKALLRKFDIAKT
ncbi:MAG TPA: ABC transporter ATP-binding protein [Candidatus Saccharimonadales bacterium]|nr:ABC transporter ATP-binding protein [Candidatus Saccharimonadales bacterium]